MFFVTGSISYLLLSLFVVCSFSVLLVGSFVTVSFVHVMALMVGWMLELKLVVLEVVLDVAGWYWKALGGRTGGRNDGCADWRGDGQMHARLYGRCVCLFGVPTISVAFRCVLFTYLFCCSLLCCTLSNAMQSVVIFVRVFGKLLRNPRAWDSSHYLSLRVHLAYSF
jgi:hypothetical protein